MVLKDSAMLMRSYVKQGEVRGEGHWLKPNCAAVIQMDVVVPTSKLCKLWFAEKIISNCSLYNESSRDLKGTVSTQHVQQRKQRDLTDAEKNPTQLYNKQYQKFAAKLNTQQSIH